MNKIFLLLFLPFSLLSQQNSALSLLIKGIETNNIEFVKSIFVPQKKIDINSIFPFTYGTENRELTPLLLAALVSNQAMVDFLLSEGANIAATDNAGNTVLMYALRPHNEAMFNDLIAHNAPLEKQRKDGITVLMMASAWGYDTFVEAILKSAQQKGILHNYRVMRDQKGKTAEEYAKSPTTKELMQKYSATGLSLSIPLVIPSISSSATSTMPVSSGTDNSSFLPTTFPMLPSQPFTSSAPISPAPSMPSSQSLLALHMQSAPQTHSPSLSGAQPVLANSSISQSTPLVAQKS